MARAKSKNETPSQNGAENGQPEDGTPAADRIFLVVVDESEELGVALRFACRRAMATGGRVALFYVVEPADFGHWMAVEDLMEKERRTRIIFRLFARCSPVGLGATTWGER